jgi:hypothetical protein
MVQQRRGYRGKRNDAKEPLKEMLGCDSGPKILQQTNWQRMRGCRGILAEAPTVISAGDETAKPFEHSLLP